MEVNHLASHIVDRMASGTADPEMEQAARLHAAACATCSRRLAEARAERDSFLAQNPPGIRSAQMLASCRRRRVWWSSIALAGAAAASIVVVARTSPPDERPAVLEKGGPGVSFLVRPREGGPDRMGRSGEALRAGDTVQLRIDAGAFRQIAILSMDERGAVTWLASLQPSTQPPSLVLDEAPQAERIFVVLSEQPPARAEVEGAARKAFAAAGRGLGSLETFAVQGAAAAQVRSILIRKVRADLPRSGGPDVSLDGGRR